MRPSSRTAILQAARKLAARRGIGSLTLDAAAREAGLSRGGLHYHFATKSQLMIAVIEHITASWEEEMLAELDKPFAATSTAERVRAYSRVVAAAKTGRGELAIFVDSLHEEELASPWHALAQRWLDTPEKPAAAGERTVDLAVARLAADGLWMANGSDMSGYDANLRAAILARIEQLTTGPDQAT